MRFPVRICDSFGLLPVPTLLVLAAALSAEEQKPPTEVIQVSATKQTEEQHRLPASVTPITREQLDSRSARSLAEEWQLSPNVTQFTDKPNGGLTVRGVGSGEQPRFGGEENPTRGRNPAVVLYVDGAPVDAERGLAAFDDPLDLERAELLRGPQGTLYGRNALGGVVALTSRDPGEQAELYGRVLYGTDNELRASVAGGGPLGDSLGLRLAAGYSQSDGSLSNVTRGDDQTAAWDRVQARGKVVFQVDDALALRLSVGGSRYDGSTDVWVPFERREERETFTNAKSSDEITGATAALQADWTVSRELRLTTVIGLARAEQEVAYDGDRNARDLTSTSGTNTADTGSFEARLARGGKETLTWLAGVFAAKDVLDYDTRTRFSTDPVTQSFNPFVPVGTPYNIAIGQPSDYHKGSEVAATSAALFGEATWQMSTRWRLTVGARVSYEASKMDWSLDQSGSFNPQIPNGTFSFSDERDEVQILPKAALAHQIDEWKLLYASLARGYRAGGLNANATSVTSAQIEYDPEFTWNYELGWRSLWLERSLALNVTGFFIDWRDQQVFTERAPFDVIQSNGERAHVLGAEAEIRWQTSTGVALWANGGVQEAEVDERTGQEFQSDGVGGYNASTIDYAGNRFAHVPEWTWALGASYRHALGVFVRGDVHGHSWTYADDRNTERADGVVQVDARLGYDGGWWTIAGVGRNLTDETDVLTSITLPGDFIYTTNESTYVRLAPARSLGLEVSARW